MKMYLNGNWVDEAQAGISPLDRGFLFGDGVYEVTPIYHGHYFYLDEHITRLQYSLDQTSIDTGWSHSRWQQLHFSLLEHNQLQDDAPYQCYLQVTRGCDGSRHHAIDRNTKPTIMAMLSRQAAQAKASVRLVSQEDYRWSRCDIKSTSLLGNVLLLDQAKQQQADETLLHRQGIITEAASANVFIVIDGCIHTPKLSHKLLPGITRNIIISLAEALNIPVITRDIPLSDIQHCQEAWISSSTRTLMPCDSIDHYQLQTLGPVSLAIQKAYQTHIQTHCCKVSA